MPNIGPMGRGGARRRTRRRMTAMSQASQQAAPSEEQAQPSEEVGTPVASDKLVKLARLLKDKGVISEEEFSLIFD